MSTLHSTLYTVLGVAVIAVITVVALVVSTRRNLPEILAAQRAFFTETGYRYPEIASAPIEEQVRHVPRIGNAMTMSLHKHYVRPDPRGALAFDSTRTSERGKRVRRESWRLALTTAPAIRLQIVERALLPSLGKTVREMATHRTRTWTQVYPGPIAIEDAALAQRFAVFGDQPDAIRRLLAQPAVRDRLLACAEVDLVVDDHSVLLSDPAGKNLAAGRGSRGPSLNPAPRLRDSIPVHCHVHAMLGAVRDGVVAA